MLKKIKIQTHFTGHRFVVVVVAVVVVVKIINKAVLFS